MGPLPWPGRKIYTAGARWIMETRPNPASPSRLEVVMWVAAFSAALIWSAIAPRIAWPGFWKYFPRCWQLPSWHILLRDFHWRACFTSGCLHTVLCSWSEGITPTHWFPYPTGWVHLSVPNAITTIRLAISCRALFRHWPPEILVRRNVIPAAAWRNFFIVSFCLGFSAFTSWLVVGCVGFRRECRGVLGTRAIWDTPIRHVSGLIGATTALIVLGRWRRQPVRAHVRPGGSRRRRPFGSFLQADPAENTILLQPVCHLPAVAELPLPARRPAYAAHFSTCTVDCASCDSAAWYPPDPPWYPANLTAGTPAPPA